MFKTGPIFEQLEDHPSVHCATLVELADGRLLAAWFGGSYETAPDVVILAAYYDPEQASWSQPRVIAQVAQHALGQPVFLVRPDGELWLFFDVITDRDWTSAQPYLQRSHDNGRTWSTQQQLFDYPGFMFRSRPCVLADRILLPAYDENTWQSRMMISDDDGETWRIGPSISTPQGNIHACLAALDHENPDSGSLLAYLRTGGKGGVIWRTESADRGETWCEPTPTPFPNPNSGIDLLRLESGALALAYNDSDCKRTPLCVAWAQSGERFTQTRTLEDADAEFSYPTLLQDRSGTIHLVYTYQRRHIQHACFDEAWLRGSRTK